ncbi:unnamed protein product, partial [Meganyctiphanes norvegica]
LHLFSWEEFLPTFIIDKTALHFSWNELGIQCDLSRDGISSNKYLPANQDHFISFEMTMNSTIIVRSKSIMLLSTNTGNYPNKFTASDQAGGFLLTHIVHTNISNTDNVKLAVPSSTKSTEEDDRDSNIFTDVLLYLFIISLLVNLALITGLTICLNHRKQNMEKVKDDRKTVEQDTILRINAMDNDRKTVEQDTILRINAMDRIRQRRVSTHIYDTPDEDLAKAMFQAIQTQENIQSGEPMGVYEEPIKVEGAHALIPAIQPDGAVMKNHVCENAAQENSGLQTTQGAVMKYHVYENAVQMFQEGSGVQDSQGAIMKTHVHENAVTFFHDTSEVQRSHGAIKKSHTNENAVQNIQEGSGDSSDDFSIGEPSTGM